MIKLNYVSLCYRILIILLFSFAFESYGQIVSTSKIDQKTIDSIVKLRDGSRDKSKSLEERFTLAERARRISLQTKIDSTIIKSNRRISVIYSEMKNYNLYRKVNRETLSLSKKIGDSSSMAKANLNLGNFYYRTLNSDSAYFYYYNAEKIYTRINELFNAGKVLQNMAIIQQNEKDFIGSEKTGIKAIKYITPFLETEDDAYIDLSGIYNNLGLVSGELDLYEDAIEYFQKAIAIRKKYRSKGENDEMTELKKKLEERSLLTYQNNLGTIYEQMEDYKTSINYFSDVLKADDVIDKESPFYPRVLNNYARNRFLLDKDDEVLPELYFKALKIRENINDKGGVMRSSIDIANYYLTHKKLDSASWHAYRALDLSKKYDRFDDQLETLLLLSNIERDDKALDHAQAYIALSDILQKKERSIRNKFAKIEFETERIEEEKEKLSRERMWFLLLAIGLGITAFLVYIIISQRSKNKELKFNQEQQQANEEIYNLMLSQQDKIEEGRTQEKKRISEDLHDGILGRLFGTRLSLDSLNLSSEKDAVKNRGQYIEELKSIEQEIRRISHDLNTDFVAGSGYLDIVKTLIENQTQAYQLNYEFNHKDEIDWETVSNKTKIHFYRMIQESLQNIYKHANASHVNISFELKNNQIYLNIVDDGEGFVVNKAKKGIGLKNIKSRVEELKGELFINSQKDAGTRISISVPF